MSQHIKFFSISNWSVMKNNWHHHCDHQQKHSKNLYSPKDDSACHQIARGEIMTSNFGIALKFHGRVDRTADGPAVKSAVPRRIRIPISRLQDCSSSYDKASIMFNESIPSVMCLQTISNMGQLALRQIVSCAPWCIVIGTLRTHCLQIWVK